MQTHAQEFTQSVAAASCCSCCSNCSRGRALAAATGCQFAATSATAAATGNSWCNGCKWLLQLHCCSKLSLAATACNWLLQLACCSQRNQLQQRDRNCKLTRSYPLYYCRYPFYCSRYPLYYCTTHTRVLKQLVAAARDRDWGADN